MIEAANQITEPSDFRENMQVATAALTDFKGMFTQVGDLHTYLEKVGVTAIHDLDLAIRGKATLAVGELTQSLAELDGLFQKVSGQDIELAFQSFGQALATGGKKHIVNIGDHRLNVHINVHIRLGRHEMVEYLSGDRSLSRSARLQVRGT